METPLSVDKKILQSSSKSNLSPVNNNNITQQAGKISKSNSSVSSIKTKSGGGTRALTNLEKSRDKNSLLTKTNESPLQTILSVPRDTPNSSILTRGSFKVNNSNGSTPNSRLNSYASMKNLNINGLNSSINVSKMNFDVSVNYKINERFTNI